MSEEYIEEGEEQLSAEELFEQHQAEIAERFQERNVFQRLGVLFKGISKPHNTREYKEAMTELQRLQAPILAVLLPTLGVIVLIVLTAVTTSKKDVLQVEVARANQEEEALEEEVEAEPEEIDMTQDIDVSVDVAVDTPNVTTEIMSQSESPGGEPDTVMASPSPVTMSNIKASSKMRGLGDGDGGGFGTAIKAGKAVDLTGALIGEIIDLKTKLDPSDPNGKGIDIGYSPHGSDFFDRLKVCEKGNFSDAACSGVRKLPKRVANTHIFIPPQSANNGPRAFGVQDMMEPKGWVAYYKGEIVATEKAKYRFWGYFDDFMMVRINKKVVWEYTWPCDGKRIQGRVSGWTPPAEVQDLLGKYVCPQTSGYLAPGEWFETAPGKKMLIEIVVGEKPGGACGGILQIEKQGETYEKGPSGTPVFPIFASRRLSYKEIEKLDAFDGKSYNGGRECNPYKIGTENIPVFNSAKATKANKAKEKKKSVEVEVDI